MIKHKPAQMRKVDVSMGLDVLMNYQYGFMVSMFFWHSVAYCVLFSRERDIITEVPLTPPAFFLFPFPAKIEHLRTGVFADVSKPKHVNRDDS
jgi:hypothetical protein